MPELNIYRGVYTITFSDGKQLILTDIDYELVESRGYGYIGFKLKNDADGWKKGDIIEIDNNGRIAKV